MRTYCLAQGTLRSALWWPGQEGSPEVRTCTCDCRCTCDWFIWQYSRNEHSLGKQLHSNKINFKKCVMVTRQHVLKEHCSYYFMKMSYLWISSKAWKMGLVIPIQTSLKSGNLHCRDIGSRRNGMAFRVRQIWILILRFLNLFWLAPRQCLESCYIHIYGHKY